MLQVATFQNFAAASSVQSFVELCIQTQSSTDMQLQQNFA